MDYDDFNNGSSPPHPWITSDGNFAPPSSPAGGGGPGQFRVGRPLNCTFDFGASVPDAQSPAARTFALDAAAINSLGATANAGLLAAPTIKLTASGVIVGGGPLNDATIFLINEAAKKATNKRYIAYESLVKVGGSIAWRANNPGNLRDAPTKIGTAPGAVGTFAVFATMDDGRAAQKSLYLHKYGSMTVRDAVQKLTPPEDKNDTPAYLDKLEKAGVVLDTDVKSQIDKLMSAVEANEGMISGTDVPRAK